MRSYFDDIVDPIFSDILVTKNDLISFSGLLQKMEILSAYDNMDDQFSEFFVKEIFHIIQKKPKKSFLQSKKDYNRQLTNYLESSKMMLYEQFQKLQENRHFAVQEN